MPSSSSSLPAPRYIHAFPAKLIRFPLEGKDSNRIFSFFPPSFSCNTYGTKFRPFHSVDGKINMKAYEKGIDAKRSVSVAMNFPRRRWWDTQRRTRMTGGSVATCYCSRFFPPPFPLLNRFYEQKSGKLLRLEIDSTSSRNRRILPVSQFLSYLFTLLRAWKITLVRSISEIIYRDIPIFEAKSL